MASESVFRRPTPAPSVLPAQLGIEWGEKKSICNKFPQSQAVTCITWPSEHPQEVVFGTAEGKMKVGQLKTNKALTMYTTGSYTVSTCSR